MTATKRTVMCALTWKEISYQNEAQSRRYVYCHGTSKKVQIQKNCSRQNIRKRQLWFTVTVFLTLMILGHL